MPATTQRAIELIFEFNNQYQYYWSASIMASLETIMENAMAVPLDIASREIADGFALKAGRFAERVRRNTLAVLAVNHYLSWQGIETNLEAGKSWNPALRLVSDVADLHVKNVGCLECRVIAPGATTIDIPLEVRKDRVAYMVLELSEQPLGGKLLGLFVPGAEPVYSIALSDLKDMDESIEYLSELESATVPVISAIASTESTIAAAVKERVIEVGRWFNGGLDRVSESLNAILLRKEISYVMGEKLGEFNLNNIIDIINERQRSNGNKEIPDSAAQTKYLIEGKYYLCVFVWKLPKSSNEWAILAAIVTSETVEELPLGLAIDIHDETKLLEEIIVESSKVELLHVCAFGDSYGEKLRISVTLLDKTSIFSEQFTFSSNIE